MKQLHIPSELNSLVQAVKAKFNKLNERIFLNVKGDAFKEKHISVQNSLNRLFKNIGDEEKNLEDLRNIEEFLKLLQKENKNHLTKEMVYSIYHLIELYHFLRKFII